MQTEQKKIDIGITTGLLVLTALCYIPDIHDCSHTSSTGNIWDLLTGYYPASKLNKIPTIHIQEKTDLKLLIFRHIVCMEVL